MIGYTTPMLRAKAPIVKQDFDAIDESELGIKVAQPSLSDYDRSEYDDDNTDILLGLDRWGDRRMAS